LIYVKDVMTRRVRTATKNETVAGAARAMAKWKIGSLVIVERGVPIGIITEGDISRFVARGLDPESTPVSVARKRLITTTTNERMEVAAKTMADGRVKKLPVVEEGKLVGIITQTDIVSSSFALVTSLKEMVQARYRPPDFQM